MNLGRLGQAMFGPAFNDVAASTVTKAAARMGVDKAACEATMGKVGRFTQDFFSSASQGYGAVTRAFERGGLNAPHIEATTLAWDKNVNDPLKDKAKDFYRSNYFPNLSPTQTPLSSWGWSKPK